MNPSTTPTPRTDDVMLSSNWPYHITSEMQKLERELTEKTNEVERLREEIERFKLQAKVKRFRKLLERAIEIADEFWKNQKQAVTIYHCELADELDAIRWEIDPLETIKKLKKTK